MIDWSQRLHVFRPGEDADYCRLCGLRACEGIQHRGTGLVVPEDEEHAR